MREKVVDKIGLAAGLSEHVEVSLESMQGVVDVVDPTDFTDNLNISGISSRLLQQQTEAVLSSLTKRQRTVLKMRFGLEDGKAKTFAEIAKAIGKSPSTVRRDERAAFRALRHPSKNFSLEDFLL